MEQILEFIRKINFIDLILGLGVSYLVITLGKIYLRKRKTVREFKEEKAKLESNKCEGAHNWIEMKIMGQKTHVCRDCYWSPKYDAFVMKFFVDAEVERMEFEEGLKRYKQQRIEELAAKYFIETDDLKIVAEEILKIKRDFTTQHLDKKIKELLGEKIKTKEL